MAIGSDSEETASADSTTSHIKLALRTPPVSYHNTLSFSISYAQYLSLLIPTIVYSHS